MTTGPSLSPLQRVPTFTEDEATRARREHVVAECLEHHLVLADRFEEITGMRLPESLACFAGFYLSLSEDEKVWLVGTAGDASLLGVLRWLVDGISGRLRDSDPRLDDRDPNDPIEFLPVFQLDPERKYGLYYDDAHDLPTGVALVSLPHPHVPTARRQLTLLEPTLLRMIYRARRAPVRILESHPEDWEPEIKRRILAWLGEVVQNHESKAAQSRVPLSLRRGTMLDGVQPYLNGFEIAADLASFAGQKQRRAALDRRDASAVRGWVSEALRELGEGSPVRAIFIGRDLHWFGAKEFSSQACELLMRSYAALKMRPFVDLTRAHYERLYPDTKFLEVP